MLRASDRLILWGSATSARYLTMPSSLRIRELPATPAKLAPLTISQQSARCIKTHSYQQHWYSHYGLL